MARRPVSIPRVRRSIAFLAALLLVLSVGGEAAGAGVASYHLTVDPDARTVGVHARVEVEGPGSLVLYLAPFARDIDATAADHPFEAALGGRTLAGPWCSPSTPRTSPGPSSPCG